MILFSIRSKHLPGIAAFLSYTVLLPPGKTHIFDNLLAVIVSDLIHTTNLP
jgi:hypothetical protein